MLHCLNRIKDIFSMLGACILKYLYIEDKEDTQFLDFVVLRSKTVQKNHVCYLIRHVLLQL